MRSLVPWSILRPGETRRSSTGGEEGWNKNIDILWQKFVFPCFLGPSRSTISTAGRGPSLNLDAFRYQAPDTTSGVASSSATSSFLTGNETEDTFEDSPEWYRRQIQVPTRFSPLIFLVKIGYPVSPWKKLGVGYSLTTIVSETWAR